MQKVHRNIGLAVGMVASNVWLLTDGDGRRFLIDTGHRFERTALHLGLWRAGVRRRGDLAAVLLTHRHSDHAGNASWLRARFRCPVVCHENDAMTLAGAAEAPSLQRGLGNPIDKLFCRLEDHLPARSAVDDSVTNGPWKHGFVVYPAFGHTEGSVLYYHEPSQTLFSGDALLTGIPPIRLVESFGLAVPAYSLNVQQCHRLMLDFLRTPPPIRQLCSGHGPFVHRDTAAKLQRFYERASR